MTDDNNNSLIPLIKEVSEMKGVLSQVVTQLVTQQGENAAATAAVKVVADATASMVAGHTVEIANIKVDIASIQTEKQGSLGKVMAVISPILAGLAIFLAMAKDLYVR